MTHTALLLFRPFPEMDCGPVFTLRQPRDREAVEFRHTMRVLGYVSYDNTELRDEALRALKALWPAKVYSANAARLRRNWMKLDADRPLPPAEARALEDLGNRLAETWPRFAEMAACNTRFQLARPKVAASTMLDAWTGLNVPVRRELGRVPLATIDAIEQALAEIEGGADPPKTPGTAFADLCAAAMLRINQTFASPANPKSNQNSRKSHAQPDRRGE